MDKQFDTIIKNARVVRPNKTSVDCLDIAIKNGKIAQVRPEIQADLGRQVFDAKNRLAFPGCVDAHMHIGIYAPLAQDASSSSRLSCCKAPLRICVPTVMLPSVSARIKAQLVP